VRLHPWRALTGRVLAVPEVMDAVSGHENLVARALVRILDKSGDHFGFGLLVADGRVVTCAHVVAGSMGEPDELAVPPARGRVRLEFPFIAPGQVLTAAASAWQAMAATAAAMSPGWSSMMTCLTEHGRLQ